MRRGSHGCVVAEGNLGIPPEARRNTRHHLVHPAFLDQHRVTTSDFQHACRAARRGGLAARPSATKVPVETGTDGRRRGGWLAPTITA